MISICGLREGIRPHRVHTTLQHVGETKSRSYPHWPFPKYIYNSATATLKLHQDSNKIKLQRGAREGENISPRSRMFTVCLQNTVLNKINWENCGINIDGEHLAHLDFTDDIIMMDHTPQELEKMLNDLHTTSKPV